MSHKDVSPKQGHASLATPSVNQATGHSLHRSRNLFSQFRGPFVYNETDEERERREEEEERNKKSNFKKVQEAREAAEARAAEAERKLKEREEADKKAAEKKLEEDKQFETLAKQREEEAKAATEQAQAAEARANAAEQRLKEIEDEKKAELNNLIESLPEEAKADLPIDDHMSTDQKLRIVRREKAMLEKEDPADPVGAGVRHKASPEKADRYKELVKKPRRTEAESQEMLKLDQELNQK